ncbi:cilia- and flagella-associated protein HOATZ isoform X2 [Ictalurus furcatus]|uniref:cilia- and flagella-associated protein HOATZ isoform X2 n=1 Tax=Ictalurus furcatus TaxID=66913 RepID=UPI002350C6ED|nr:cilia- and flagella-associated protein HOATZ isoform X2 [Ictalurus furcatus]
MSEVSDKVDAVETLSDGGVCYTVFEGSSQEDVAYAKVFWSSLCLQPPIESSLVALDITQRLKVAKAPQTSNTVPTEPPWSKNDEILQKAYQLQMQDEKQRYLEMAKKHDEIMALLKKHREDRIKKEMVSRLHKPRRPELTERRNGEMDVRRVLAFSALMLSVPTSASKVLGDKAQSSFREIRT